MISPEEIRRKAQARYRPLLTVWLDKGDTDSLFPMLVPFRHIKSTDDSRAAAEAEHLLSPSAQTLSTHPPPRQILPATQDSVSTSRPGAGQELTVESSRHFELPT